MRTRYDVAKDVGFSESENSPGLMSWLVKGSGMRIFLDFRTKDDDGEWDGFAEDMPPRIYAAVDDDEGETTWVNDTGDTKEQWRKEVKGHWIVEKVEEQSGLEDDRGQTGLDWFTNDGVEERECRDCGDTFPVTDIEDGLCLGDETNECFLDEHPSELVRRARQRKERIREERRETSS